MNTSAFDIDEDGIRRQGSTMPKRYTVNPAQLHTLRMLVDMGKPDSIEWRGWMNILIVHGYTAVLEAVANCYLRAGGPTAERVRNEAVQAVLDGRLPDGGEIVPQRTAQRRPRVA